MTGTLTGQKPEGVCHQCGERLSLVKRMKNETFCSPKCRDQFSGFDQGLALERLKTAPTAISTPRALRREGEAEPQIPNLQMPEPQIEVFATPIEKAPEPTTAPAANEEIEPSFAGFRFEVSARAIAMPNAFSEGAFGEPTPLPNLVRFPAAGQEIIGARYAVASSDAYLPIEIGEFLDSAGASLLQVVPHPLSTLGDPRFPVCGLGVDEFDWDGVNENLSTPPEATWVGWTWSACDFATPTASFEPEVFGLPAQMQLPVWVQLKRELTPGSGHQVPLSGRALTTEAGIWPGDEEEVLTWRRTAPAVPAVSDMSRVPDAASRGTEPSGARLPEASWVAVPARPLDDLQLVHRRLLEASEYGLPVHTPAIPLSALDGELPGRPRILPDEPAEMLFPFVIVDNTGTQSLRSWHQETGESVVRTDIVALGQPEQWSRHLALAPAAVAAAPAEFGLSFQWPDARAFATPVVCGFQSHESWDVI